MRPAVINNGSHRYPNDIFLILLLLLGMTLAAATNAGFEARSTIGIYLRELISGHHDTLAIKVE